MLENFNNFHRCIARTATRIKLYRTRHGRSHLLVFGSYSHARNRGEFRLSFARIAQQEYQEGTRNRPTCMANARHNFRASSAHESVDARCTKQQVCNSRRYLHGHVRQGNWVRKIHPRDSAVYDRIYERRGGELESEKRYRHADSRLRRDFSNANWPTLIFRGGRISNRWIV